MATKAKDGSILSTVWLDGKLHVRVKGHEDVVLDPDKASAQVRARAMAYGFEVRLLRSAALSRDSDTGASATPEEKRQAIAEVAAHLASGSTDWNMKPTARAPKGPDAGTIILAIVRAGLAADVDTANGKVAKLATKRNTDRDAALLAFYETAEVRTAYDAIMASKVTVSAATLMEELDEEAGDDVGEGEGE